MLTINAGGSGIPPYPVMMLLSFAAGMAVLYRLCRRGGVPGRICGCLLLLSPPLALYGAYLLHLLTVHDGTVGFSSVGGLAGMYAAAFIMQMLCKAQPYAAEMPADCTFVLPLMYGISKIGCFLAGCCRGIPYSGVFSVVYAGTAEPSAAVFPVQAAESAVFLVIFVLGLLLHRKRRNAALYAVFFISCAAKFLLDFLRESHQGTVLSLNQGLCLGMAAACTAVLLYRRHRENLNHQTEKEAGLS